MLSFRKLYLISVGLLSVVISFFFFTEVKGQTKTYLTGQKTGNKLQSGTLIGLGTGTAGLSSPMLSEAWGCLVGVQTNQFRFYYGDPTILTNLTTSATTLKASRSFGLLGLLGSGADVYVQFRNVGNATIAAGTPTYFKLKERPTNSGISLAVGGLLGVTELNSISGNAYSGATNYTLNTATLGVLSCPNPFNGNENNGIVAGTSTTRLLLDASGDWYAKVTPSAAYNSVRLNLAIPSDLSLASVDAEINVNVYNAFTQTDGSACNLSPQFTSPGEALGGIALNTVGVGGLTLSELVSNPEKAINGNANDYSAFSSGLASVGVANQVAQSFYFDHKATTNDGIRLQLGIQGSLIDLDLLKLATIKFNAYNGSSLVYQSNLKDIATLLHLNLLNLVTVNGSSSHKKLDFIFNPEVQFDRLEVIFDQGIASVGVLGDALRIYEVSLAPSLPIITLQPTNAASTNICEGSTAMFNVAASPVDATFQWQYFNTVDSTWANVPSATSSTLNISSVTSAMNNRWYRVKVTGGNLSCPQDVFSDEAKLTVASPTITLGANPEICAETLTALLPYTATTCTPTQYKIDWSIGSPFTAISYTALPSSSPISISIPAATPAATYSGTITVKNSSNTESNAVPFSIKINPKPTITLGAVPDICIETLSASIPYSATTAAPTEYMITWNGGSNLADIPYTTLTSSPITITIPPSANTTTHNGTITVKNANGCISDPIPFTLKINAKPPTPHLDVTSN